MIRRLIAALLLCSLCAFVNEAYASIPRTPPPATQDQKVEDDFIISPYATGYLTYRSERLMWFAVVEKRSSTVGVLILSQGRREFRMNTGPDIPIVFESFREGGQVATYLPFRKTLCELEALEHLACPYREFTDDVVVQLRRIPEFMQICASGYVSMPLEQTSACQPTK